MKAILLITLTLFSVNSFADWTEYVECTVERASVDDLTVVTSTSITALKMDGPHNGEYGEFVVTSDLIPSYKVTYSKSSGGRNDEAALVTQLGNKIVAASSVDAYQSESVVNKFMTQQSDYQITITCTSSAI